MSFGQLRFSKHIDPGGDQDRLGLVSHASRRMLSKYSSICLRDLCPFTPNDLSSSCHHTQLTDIDFDDRSFGQNTELSIHGILRVLLDLVGISIAADCIASILAYRDNRQLNSNAQFWMCDIALFVSETHRSNESLVLDRTSGKVWNTVSNLSKVVKMRYMYLVRQR